MSNALNPTTSPAPVGPAAASADAPATGRSAV